MKAAFYTRNGPASQVIEVGEKPTPTPRAGEVLVRLAFSGVNPSDVKSRAARPLNGAYQIPHSDGSGTVEAVGEGVDASRIGERVWTWNAAWQRADGTAAEYVALPSQQAVALPEDVALEAAACLGIPGMTAAHAVELLAAESDAKTVLVTGAGNAVGNLACQMAKQAGFTVIGTASARRKALAEKAGCKAVIDPYGGDLAKAVLEANGGMIGSDSNAHGTPEWLGGAQTSGKPINKANGVRAPRRCSACLVSHANERAIGKAEASRNPPGTASCVEKNFTTWRHDGACKRGDMGHVQFFPQGAHSRRAAHIRRGNRDRASG